MSTNSNSIAGAVGSLIGGAASGPLNIIQAVASLGQDLIDRFIPDPAQKIAAAQHLIDVQQALTLAQIDQQNKIMTATSTNQANDPHASGSRAYFCYGVTTMLLVNYGVAPFVASIMHWPFQPFGIPPTIMGIFATIMLGWVGIPAGADMVKSVMGMDGDSSISALGVGIKQNSAK